MQSKMKYTVFADYNQIYLQTENADFDPLKLCTTLAVENRFFGQDNLFCFMTARNMDVPVTVEIYEDRPDLRLEGFDHIIESHITTDDGVLIMMGATESFDDAPRITVAKGGNAIRISMKNLDDLSGDGLDGNDEYLVQIWKCSAMTSKVVKLHPLT